MPHLPLVGQRERPALARAVAVGKDGPVLPPVIALLGPTASGKSDAALHLARELDSRGQLCEIVNADSMLVYRGMDIGTAKPSPRQRRLVPHHVVDVLDVTEASSVSLVQQWARQAVEGCRDRGVVPLVVGGSVLYSRAVLDRLEIPPTDPQVRARWQHVLDTRGPAALHAKLAELDPEAAAEILPGNGRRLVRALEVVELTGSFTARMPEPTHLWPDTVELGLGLPREALDERIARRVDRMWDDGLVAEVDDLVGRGLREGPTASRALGYRQVLQMRDGLLDEDQAREQTVVRTRRFARKQLMWYRRDPRITWFDALAPDLGRTLLARVSDVLDDASTRPGPSCP